jgi:hypothetical protein
MANTIPMQSVPSVPSVLEQARAAAHFTPEVLALKAELGRREAALAAALHRITLRTMLELAAPARRDAAEQELANALLILQDPAADSTARQAALQLVAEVQAALAEPQPKQSFWQRLLG